MKTNVISGCLEMAIAFIYFGLATLSPKPAFDAMKE
jgi:hypothetical protein